MEGAAPPGGGGHLLVEGRVIRMRGVGFAYAPGSPVLEAVDLEIEAGLTLLVGPNGSGKSTLLKIAAGVEKPDAGRVEIDGADLWRDEVRARSRLAYVPEHPDLTPYASLSEVMDLVVRLRGAPPAAGREALERTGLAGMGRRTIRELSMGQRRRALVAAAMIGQADILLLDEPLESMDREMKESLLRWIRESARRGATVLLVTHTVEPFLDDASRAVAARAGSSPVLHELPAPGAARTELIDRLARGAEPA